MKPSTHLPRFALAALLGIAVPLLSHAAVFVGVSVNIAPPALPVYVQPPMPAAGYVWTPGYWAWDVDGYYWVPGTWVLAPMGMLWTPGYWGWADGAYLWHAGYWGPHIGFYGGINYGFGYTGVGYAGGYWRGGSFFYNRSVNNVTNVNVTNVYNKTVINNTNIVRTSFNGGNGGITAQPTAAEMRAAGEPHTAFTPEQQRHVQGAAKQQSLRASVNGGHPAMAATAHPATFAARPAPQGGPRQLSHGQGPQQQFHNARPGPAAHASPPHEPHGQGQPREPRGREPNER
jgi:hypothetical protein